MVAASRAVNPPIHATTVNDAGSNRNTGYILATRKTPAVTIVAAWIRADTGVGPSIASGSHTYNGICALLPNAPSMSRYGIALIDQPPASVL